MFVIIKLPYKYMFVCPTCQPPNVRHLSSHLTMAHGLNANERTNHLKQAIMCPPTSLIQARRLPNTTTVRAKLKNIRQDRRVVEHSQKSSDKTPTSDVLPEPYLTVTTAIYCHGFVFFMLSLFNTVSLTAHIY